MLSAFSGKKEVVVVAVNYTSAPKEITLDIADFEKIKTIRQYITTASDEDNMKPYQVTSLKKLLLRPRSINTVVIQR
jgi:hypothetical protein